MKEKNPRIKEMNPVQYTEQEKNSVNPVKKKAEFWDTLGHLGLKTQLKTKGLVGS